MSRLGWLEKLQGRFVPRIAGLFNIAPSQLTVEVVKGLSATSGDGRLAQGGNYGIQFDKRFFRTAEKADVRGAFIHEATHALGVGMGTEKAETLADLARYLLNPKEADYWKPTDEVLRAAQEYGVDMAQPNGPRPGRTHGRMRNTLVNNASKATPTPVVSPSSALNLGSQTAMAQSSFMQILAAIKAQRAALQGQFMESKAAAKAGAISNMASSVNAALDRGLVGSSADLKSRAAVLAEKEAAIQAAIQERLAGKMGLKTQRIAAQNEFYNNLFYIQAQRAAEQATMANDAFMQDMVMRLGDESSPQADALLEFLKQLIQGGMVPPAVTGSGVHATAFQYPGSHGGTQ